MGSHAGVPFIHLAPVDRVLALGIIIHQSDNATGIGHELFIVTVHRAGIVAIHDFCAIIVVVATLFHEADQATHACLLVFSLQGAIVATFEDIGIVVAVGSGATCRILTQNARNATDAMVTSLIAQVTMVGASFQGGIGIDSPGYTTNARVIRFAT